MAFKFAEQFIRSGRFTNSEAYDGYAVTPNDTLATYQAQVPNSQGTPADAQGFYATGAGTVAVVLDAAGNTATFTVGAGTLVPVDFIQIKATGTSATGLFALFRNGG